LRLSGTVVAAYGRQYRIELADGTTLLCVPRGKKSELVCGDQVSVLRTSADQGVISALELRRSLLYRSDHFKQKLIAANVTQVIIVVATEPAFSDELITRCIVAAESQDIEVLIVLNKCDLLDKVAVATATLAPYQTLGYRVLPLCARNDGARLLPYLAGHTSLLIGQSGMGKSTLTNALVPDACAPTREISQALHTGKHTTTHASLYRPGASSALIDSPGPDRIRPAASVGGGHLAGIRRIAAAARPMPLPRLPTRPRTGLQHSCRSPARRHRSAPLCGLPLTLCRNRLTSKEPSHERHHHPPPARQEPCRGARLGRAHGRRTEGRIRSRLHLERQCHAFQAARGRRENCR
jgi:ribosome biogenesis GTPase